MAGHRLPLQGLPHRKVLRSGRKQLVVGLLGGDPYGDCKLIIFNRPLADIEPHMRTCQARGFVISEGSERTGPALGARRIDLD